MLYLDAYTSLFFRLSLHLPLSSVFLFVILLFSPSHFLALSLLSSLSVSLFPFSGERERERDRERERESNYVSIIIITTSRHTLSCH